MPNCFTIFPENETPRTAGQEALRQETLFPSLRVRRSEIFAQNVEDRGKVGSAAVRLGRQRTAEAAHHARITSAVPPVRQAASPEFAVDLLFGPVGCFTATPSSVSKGSSGSKIVGVQMQFIVPRLGQQLYPFRLECLECAGKVKAAHFDVQFATRTAAYGPGSDIGPECHARGKLLRGEPALRVSPIVAVSVQRRICSRYRPAAPPAYGAVSSIGNALVGVLRSVSGPSTKM